MFFVIAAIVIVFAPAGKEKLSYILGAALIVMALGAIGASQFRFKLPGIEVDTKTNRDDHAPSISDNKSTSLESNVLKQNNFTSAV